MSRVILITSGKGGVGKSSVTINLGYALAKSGFKVCLLDCDFGLKNLDVMMGLENRVIYDLKDAIDNICTLEQVIVKDKRCDSLYLIPACKSLSLEKLNIDYMKSVISYLHKQYDFVLVDSPAGIEKGFLYASSLCQEAIIVVNLDVASLRDADRVIGLLQKKGLYQESFIINKYNEDDIKKQRSLKISDALELLSIPLIGLVYEDHDMIASHNLGTPLYLSSSHNTKNEFDAIVKRLNGENVPFQKYKKKTVLERIFK